MSDTPGATTADARGAIAILVTTVAAHEDATRIAETLVAERLAACVTSVPGARSVYRWQGAVERADEILLVVKTAPAAAERAARRLRELHPYELPELLLFDGVHASAAYAEWVRGEVGATG